MQIRPYFPIRDKLILDECIILKDQEFVHVVQQQFTGKNETKHFPKLPFPPPPCQCCFHLEIHWIPGKGGRDDFYSLKKK